MYTFLLMLIYIAFISLGLPDSLLGAGWPVMKQDLNAPVSYLGIVTMCISACTILSSLISDRMIRTFTTKTVTVFSVFLTGLALFGFSHATEFWHLLILSIPYGLGAGAIDAALNNYVALHYTSKHMSWLHCFWGVGTIISPFLMSYALSTDTWNVGYRMVSYIQLGIGILLLVTLPVWNVNKNVNTEETAHTAGLKTVLKIKGVPMILIGFFAYCAAEATAMTWAGTYFSEVKGIQNEQAAAYASLIFIGLTVGRFFGGFIMDKLGDRNMIRIGTCIAVIGILLFGIPTQSETLAVIGCIIIGFGYAPIYPCIIHATPEHFGAAHSGSLIGIQLASAYIGTTFMPPVYGFLGKVFGYEILPIFLLLFIVPMICLLEKTFQTVHYDN